MKRSLKLFNKKGQKPRRKQDIMDLDDEYSGDDYEEDYEAEDDEDDYPDEEFEREYGDSDGEYEDAYEDPDEEYDDEYYASDRRARRDYDQEMNSRRGFDGDEDYRDDYIEESDEDFEEDYPEERYERERDYRDDDISEERYESDRDYRDDEYGDDYEDADRREEVIDEDVDLENDEEESDDYYRDEDSEYDADDEIPEVTYEGDDLPEEEDVEDYEGDDYPEDDYEDEGYPEEDDVEEDYRDDDYPEDDYDGEYDEEYDREYEYERNVRAASAGRGRGRNDRGNNVGAAFAAFGGKIVDFVKESSFVERAAIIAGVAILAAAVMTVSFYSKALSRTKEINAFAEIGPNFNMSSVVGSTGLIAVADSERAKAMAANILVEEEEEEVIADDAKGVTINMTLTSIKSDIKVKFINSESGKLVANVPFVISVVTPDGTTVTYDDHDHDGIIYKKDITAGKYTVTPNPLPAEYSNYNLDTSSKTITVKDTVEMKAVDVSNEIKKESQVNAAVEDTAVQTVVESELKDTVDWDGESYTIDGDDDGSSKYEEVNKSDVDPASLSGKLSLGSVMRLSAARENSVENLKENETPSESSEDSTQGDSQESSQDSATGDDQDKKEDEKKEDNKDQSQEGNKEESQGGSKDEKKDDNKGETTPKEKIEIANGPFNLKVGDTAQIKVSKGSGIKYTSSNTSVATVSDSGLITAVATGQNVTITAYSDDYESTTTSVTVTAKEPESKGKVPVNSGTKIKLEVGKTASITSSDASLKLSCSSGNTLVATVDGTTITGVTVGTTIITVSCTGYDSEYVEVTVEASTQTTKGKIPLGITSYTIHERKTEKITSTDSALKLKFKSDDEKIATVSEGGVVTAVGEGTTNIIVSSEGYDDTPVSITVIHKELKDKAGNTLYVYENGAYRVAVYADYDTAEKFYKKISNTTKKYHGWATIDGKTYFFDNNGNMVTGEQVIGKARYTFGSDGVLSASSGTLGIDVSKWNGNIDWTKVKNSGINYVIIRCGYRGSSEGALIEDPKFKSNINGAISAGLKVGVYFFTQAVNEVEAVEEASMCINLVKGYSLSFPIYLDVEGSNGRGDAISASQRTANIKAFCGTIQNAGYTPGVYANKTWFTSKINTSQITGYKIWLAQYAESVTYNASRYDMWQYTSKGTVSGISGKVDMNILYR